MVLDGKLQARLRIAAVLIGVGLLLEVLTLSWTHPVSFMAFLFFGGSLIAAGVLIYLWTIVSQVSS